ncbi:MAG: hypothetical protein KA791_15805 [Flavobacteriales bacterium]|nr:hypothetical protein [Flavobacteriales bacterium]
MDFEPHLGIGPIRFGMNVNESRSVLGSGFAPFMKSPASVHPTDAYDALGMHIYYDTAGLCEAIELFPPAVVRLESFNLLALGYGALLAFCLSHDHDLIEDEVGFTSHVLGLGVYAPDGKEDPTSLCESIIVFRQGYYSS